MPNCAPDYYFGSPPAYRPTFVASGVTCALDVYEETRARLFGGGTFFRSKGAGEDKDLISVELKQNDDSTWSLVIRDYSSLLGVGSPVVSGGSPYIVETYGPYADQGTPPSPGDDCPGNPISSIRTAVNSSSSYIEMPTLDYGGSHVASGEDPIFDTSDPLLGDDPCASVLTETFLSGGTKGPVDGPSISGAPPETQPRTGPERTLIAIPLSEIWLDTSDDNGQKMDAQRVLQWDGFNWVEYTPNSDC